jgi:hypothetical protein
MANRGFAGSSCAKTSDVAQAMADKMEDTVFFDIVTKWQVDDGNWHVLQGGTGDRVGMA